MENIPPPSATPAKKPSANRVKAVDPLTGEFVFSGS